LTLANERYGDFSPTDPHPTLAFPREPFIRCFNAFIRWELPVDTELILHALTAIERRAMLH
jgi:hypothetical protein